MAEESSAAVAAQHVQTIIAAAEASAREIVDKAHSDAESIRRQAEQDATEHVSRARQMVELLSTGAEQLQSEVDDVVTRVAGLKAAIDAVRLDLVAAEAEVAEVGDEPDAEPEPEPEPTPEPPAEPAAPPAAQKGGSSSEGARLIALNMALSGTPREETARYLRENFDLDGQDQLLDEVYARAGS